MLTTLRRPNGSPSFLVSFPLLPPPRPSPSPSVYSSPSLYKVVSGVGLEAYWISSYLWDVVSLVPAVAFTMIVLAAADVKSLIDGEAGAATGLLFMLYTLSMVRVCFECVASLGLCRGLET